MSTNLSLGGGALDINEKPQMLALVVLLVVIYAVGGWPLLLGTVGVTLVLLFVGAIVEADIRQAKGRQ